MKLEQLREMRAWANEKLATGQEPPWAWYQYMKLRETLDAIIAGMENMVVHPWPERRLRVVDSDPIVTNVTPEIPVNLPF